MTLDPAIATAADYADALMTARRAKNTLVLIVVLLLLVELAIFFIAKYTTVIITPVGTPSATTLPTPTTRTATDLKWSDLSQYATGLAVFLGLACSLLLAMVLWLIVKIMLVGRLIGVSRLTSAFIWSLVVVLLVFPWQSFLGGSHFNDPSFKIPGVIYTWQELKDNARVGVNESVDMARLILHWARFVAWPLFAVILLLVIQVKSNRGLRQALGETTMDDLGSRADSLPT